SRGHRGPGVTRRDSVAGGPATAWTRTCWREGRRREPAERTRSEVITPRTRTLDSRPAGTPSRRLTRVAVFGYHLVAHHKEEGRVAVSSSSQRSDRLPLFMAPWRCAMEASVERCCGLDVHQPRSLLARRDDRSESRERGTDIRHD